MRILLLHGYGSTGSEMLAITAAARSWPGATFFAPNGFQSASLVPQGRQWFPLTSDPRAADELAFGAAERLRPVVHDWSEASSGAGNLLIAGHSQGALVALKLLGHLGYPRLALIGCPLDVDTAAVAMKAAGSIVLYGEKDSYTIPSDPIQSILRDAPTVRFAVCPGLTHEFDTILWNAVVSHFEADGRLQPSGP